MKLQPFNADSFKRPSAASLDLAAHIIQDAGIYIDDRTFNFAESLSSQQKTGRILSDRQAHYLEKIMDNMTSWPAHTARGEAVGMALSYASNGNLN